MKKLFLIFILIYSYLNAQEPTKLNNIDNNRSDTILFSLNDNNYTDAIFPKDFQNFSNKEKLIFISKYLFYKILLQSLEKEQVKYALFIQKNIEKEKEEIKRTGEILRPDKKFFLEKRIISNTIAYHELLKKHPNLDKKAKEFYNKHKKEFLYPKRVELSHIIVKEKKLALELLKKLKDNDNIHLFSQLSKKYSISKSKSKGGYIGLIGENGMDKKSFNILWKNKKNHIVPQVLPVKEYYSIVYLLNKHEANQESFNEKKEAIKKFLLKKEIDIWEKNKFEKRKKEVKVKLFY